MSYPYYIVPDVEEYRLLDPESERAVELARKIAANIGDVATLRLVLGIDPPEFARFYPDMAPATPSTLDTIDTFLDKFGKGEAVPAVLLEFEEDEDKSEKKPTETEEITMDKVHQDNEKPESQEGEFTLGELVKGGRYAEALKLIESQNLNNPQKNIYFAHQIRFLKKLESIENYRKTTQD